MKSVIDLDKFWKFCASLRIEDKETGLVPLNPFNTQRYLVNQIAAGLEEGIHTFTVLKFRQAGATTIGLALDLYWLNKFGGMPGTFVADSDSNREHFRSVLDGYIKSLAGGHWHIGVKSHNRNQLVFDNRSRLTYQVASSRNDRLGQGKGIAFMHACVSPGTPVIVEHGRIKSIEDVRIGDKVLTHTGAWTTVIDAITQPNTKGPMTRITPWLGMPIEFTGEHTIPTQRGIVEAKDIHKDDWLVMPVRPITKGVNWDFLPDTPDRTQHGGSKSAGAGMRVDFTKEIGFAVGYYLAEGCLIRQSVSGKPAAIAFARHRNEAHYAQRAVDAIRPFIKSHSTLDRPQTLTSVDTVYGASFASWIESWFGSVDDKRIPDEAFDWGDDFCRGLLTGLLCGDGSKTGGNWNGKKLNQVVLPTTRASIAMQARDLAASLGVGWAAISYKPAGLYHGRMCKPQWRVTWNGLGAFILREFMCLPPIALTARAGWADKYRIADGAVWIKIRKIERGIKLDTVCDLSVEHEDHTFRTPSFSIGNTECASWNNDQGLMSLMASLAEQNPNRLYLFESTAQGYNLWYDICNDAKESVVQKFIFLGWWMHERYRVERDSPIFRVYWDSRLSADERQWTRHVKQLYGHEVVPEQIAWWRYQLAEKFHGDINTLKQEMPPTEHDAFQMSGSKFFDGVKVNEAVRAAKSEKFLSFKYQIGSTWNESKIVQTIPRYAELKMWEPPHEGAVYVVAGDPAYGSSEWKDNFCAQVFRCYADGMEQVAEYASTACSTEAFAWMLCYLSGFYKNSTLILEINGPGQYVWKEMQNLRRNAATQRSTDGRSFIGAIQMFMYRRIDSTSTSAAYQWKSTHELKISMLTGFKDNFEMGRIRVRSPELCEEMVKMVRMEDGDLAGGGRSKDDRVIAAGMATEPWLRNLKLQLTARNMTREAAKATEDKAPVITALQAAVSTHLHDIGYKPPQQIGMK